MSGITWTTETRRLGDLIEWPKNPATISDHDAEQLRRSIEKFGLALPLIAQPGGDLIDGHQRKTVMVMLEEYSPDSEVDVRVPSRSLTEDERAELAVRLRRNAGEWNWDTLANEFALDDLKDWGFTDLDFELAGWDNGEEPPDDPGPQVDRAAELQQQWGTALGQVWELGDHRLVCGDCTDAAVVDAVMQGDEPRYGMHDPPYGINVVGAAAAIGGSKPFGSIGFDGVVPVNKYAPVAGDDVPFDPTYLLDVCFESVLWGANYYADRLPPMKGWIVWDKKGREDWRDTFSDCELAWSSLKTVTRIYRHTWMGMVQGGKREKRYHPTQKPAELFQRIVGDLFVDDGIVIDFYCGSGPTVIACEALNKPCRAIELSADYIAVTLQRWHDMTGRDPVLVEG